MPVNRIMAFCYDPHHVKTCSQIRRLMTCFAAKALSDLGPCQFIGFSVIIVTKADFKWPFFGTPKKASNDLSLT